MNAEVSEQAKRLHDEAPVWDIVWPWEPWCGNGFDKMSPAAAVAAVLMGSS